MRKHWLFVALAALGMFFGAQLAAAQTAAASGQAASSGQDTSSQPTHWYSPARYKKLNPANLFHKEPRDSRTASEELAANADEEKKLSVELQSLLTPRAKLRDLCSTFKTVEDCVAAIHASHNVGVRFECLKWSMTAVKPTSGTKSCADPEYAKPLTLERAIRELKPDADARLEAKNAVRKARENISDAKA